LINFVINIVSVQFRTRWGNMARSPSLSKMSRTKFLIWWNQPTPSSSLTRILWIRKYFSVCGLVISSGVFEMFQCSFNKTMFMMKYNLKKLCSRENYTWVSFKDSWLLIYIQFVTLMNIWQLI